jgi:hypothetical protein
MADWLDPDGKGHGPTFVRSPSNLYHVRRSVEAGFVPFTTDVTMLCGYTVHGYEYSDWAYYERFEDWLLCRSCHRAAGEHQARLFEHAQPDMGGYGASYSM